MPPAATGKRIAEEAQLLAEERWIVDALKKIRTVRNGLQIERLQLESLLTLQKSGSTNYPEVPIVNSNLTNEEHGRPQLVTICNSSNTNPIMPASVKVLDDGLCNFEELNLLVTNPVLNLKNPLDINTEYEEEDDDVDDSETEDNLHIDMNMFMNSQQL